MLWRFLYGFLEPWLFLGIDNVSLSQCITTRSNSTWWTDTMDSTSVSCPLGTVEGDKCQTASTEFPVLSNDQCEILRLRCRCDGVVPSVCYYHRHEYFEIFTCQQRSTMDPFGKHQKKVSKGFRVITLKMATLHHDLRLITVKKLCPTCRSEVSNCRSTWCAIKADRWNK